MNRGQVALFPSTSSASAAPKEDEELKNLQDELAKTKEQVRTEIKAERDKADGIKRKIQEEIALAQRAGRS